MKMDPIPKPQDPASRARKEQERPQWSMIRILSRVPRLLAKTARLPELLGNKIEIKEENVVKVTGTNGLCMSDTRVCTCLQGCHESDPQMQEHTLPSHLQPGALLRSDSLLMDANIEPPMIVVSDQLSPSNGSGVHTSKCLSDRAPQAETRVTRVKEEFQFAIPQQQTDDDPAMDFSETASRRRRDTNEMEYDLTYINRSTGENLPLITRFDSGSDCSIARKSVATRGDAKVYRQDTTVTLTGAMGEINTTDEFTYLRVRCSCFEVGKTISIQFFLLDDELVSGYHAYLGASDINEIGHKTVASCKNQSGRKR